MVTPYLVFAGHCRQALSFYGRAFGSSVTMLQTYGDYVPEGLTDPPRALRDWVLHAEMEICGTRFWFADEAAQPVSQGNMITLTAELSTASEAGAVFDALCEGARITLPPTETFYSAFHAGLVDRFGVSWNIAALEAPKGGSRE